MLNPHYKKYDWKLAAAQQMPHDLYIKADCGTCIHCRRNYGSDWRVRLTHELQYGYACNHPYGKPDEHYFRADFITLTISDDHYKEFRDQPQRALRLFFERFRKKFGHGLRHWFVTELGDTTARLHFHGVIINYPFDITAEDFKRRLNPPSLVGKPIPGTNKKYGKYGAFLNPNGKIKAYVEELKSVWQYGHVWVDTVRFETVNYIVKYITKNPDVQQREEFADDEFVQNWKPEVFSSPGLGKAYVEDPANIAFHNQDPKGVWYIPFERVGGKPWKARLPRYYAKYLFSEAFRRRLARERWLNPPPFKKILKDRIYRDESYYRTVLSSILSDSVLRGTSKLRTVIGIRQLPWSLLSRWLDNAASLSRQYFDAVIRTLSLCEMRPIECYNYYSHYEFASSVGAKCA